MGGSRGGRLIYMPPLRTLVAVVGTTCLLGMNSCDGDDSSGGSSASDTGGTATTVSGATLEVVGPDGEPIRCPDGELLRVKEDDVPPPAIKGGAVPRCGPEGGDGAAVWIPGSLADRVTAPDRYVELQR
jgi:hypothetical protein